MRSRRKLPLLIGLVFGIMVLAIIGLMIWEPEIQQTEQVVELDAQEILKESRDRNIEE